jgi:putative hemolysin
MIDIENEILKKFPNLKNRNSMLKNSIVKIAQKIIHEERINEFLTTNAHLEGFEFIEAVLDYFAFDFSYSCNDIENIPTTGRVVIIANHPLGALDGLCLLKLVSTVRKDVRIVANDFLEGIDVLDSLFIKINNFKQYQSKKSIQKVYKALENEEAIIMFPAGEVSRASPYGVRDGRWQKGFLRFAKNSNSPILPILIDAKNSKTFYTISILNRTFSTILLSHEMFKQKDKTINLKIGKLIPNKNIAPSNINGGVLVELYKKHLYSLKKGKKSLFQTQNPIALGESRRLIKKELREAQILGQTDDGKLIYLYSYKLNSATLKEIGRLREISFRKADEGTNKKRDIDKYDKYYQHIVLWDEDDLEIVGAYRIGDGKSILEEYGVEGFYANKLFKFQDCFKPYLKKSIELGRSFVQPKYWGTKALDYLWFGIGAYLKAHPNIKYMYGAVSISGSYSPIAQDLIVDFYSSYFESNLELVKPRNRFTYNYKEGVLLSMNSNHDYKEDLKVLKSNLKNIDATIPTLYKQYGNLCEQKGVQFCGFSVDPNFSNCIDGFIIVETQKIKESKKRKYIESHM